MRRRRPALGFHPSTIRIGDTPSGLNFCLGHQGAMYLMRAYTMSFCTVLEFLDRVKISVTASWSEGVRTLVSGRAAPSSLAPPMGVHLGILFNEKTEFGRIAIMGSCRPAALSPFHERISCTISGTQRNATCGREG